MREYRETTLNRTIKEIRFREAERQDTLCVTNAGLDRQGLAQSKEVVGAVVDPDESTGQAANAAVQANRVFAFLLDLQSEVDSAVLFIQVRSVTLGSSGFN